MRNASGRPSTRLLSNRVKRDGGNRKGKKTKPKTNSFQTIAFYSMYRARRAEHPGTAAPRGRVRHGRTDATETDGWRGEPGQPVLRGRGSVGQGSRCGGGRGPESPCPRAEGPAASVPGAPSPGLGNQGPDGTWRSRRCLWQSPCACSWPGSARGLGKPIEKQKVDAKGITALAPSGVHCPRVWGEGGRGEAGGLQSHSSQTSSKAAGRSLGQVWPTQGTGEGPWWGAGGAEAALPGPRAAPGSPSPPPRPQPTRRQLQPTHGCRGVWEQPRSWERLRPTCRPSPRPRLPPVRVTPPARTSLPDTCVTPGGTRPLPGPSPTALGPSAKQQLAEPRRGPKSSEKPQCFRFLFICTRRESPLRPERWCPVE